MNKEIVIEMAHEASPDMTWYAAIENPDQASPKEIAFLTRFAELVEQRTHTNNKARWYQEGVEAEREVIARSMDKQANLAADDIDRQWAREMAAAIRARSKFSPSKVKPSNPDPLELSRILHELAGAASMCWNPRPTGVFDSQEAIGHVVAAIQEIRSRMDT